jgi:hypothetical protein
METNSYGDYLAHGICDLEKSIGDTKASVIGAIGNAECAILDKVGSSECAIVDRMGTYAADSVKNASDIAIASTLSQGQATAQILKNQADVAAVAAAQATQFERDLQNRVHESRMILTKEIGDKTTRLADLSAANFTDVKNQLFGSELSNAKSFAHLEAEGLRNTAKILDTIGVNKYDALKNDLEALRASCYADKSHFGFALQNQEIASLKQMINSVEQTQKFASKTVQFGAGNVAIPTQTANQG